jgi:TolB-like protein
LSGTSHAVFISYASQDVEAASRICEALRASGVEVWFDRSELRGGDAWDQKIRREIRDCALFMPVISAHTAARAEGYFRLEWSLAEQRSHMIARNKVFIVPVCLDETPESAGDVPEPFQHVQWARLPGGNVPPAFTARISTLLGAAAADLIPSDATSGPSAPPVPAAPAAPRRAPHQRHAAIALIAVSVLGLVYIGAAKLRLAKQVQGQRPVAAAVPIAAPATPLVSQKSVAVLPFVDMSEKKDQEYFSDGLSEELIDHLVHSEDLKVIARTSSFQFKGKSEEVRSIARKLGVTHVLEGSVRKDGKQLRITAQLVRGSDGMHLWSQTYDRNLVDIFRVQDEIAGEVSQALRVVLRNAPRAEIHEPDIRAYNLVLEGNYFKARRNLRDVEKAVQLYQQAIDINPDYALAWARLASAYVSEEILAGPPSEKQNRRVLDALDRAMRLEPNLAWAYYTRAGFAMSIAWDWAAAKADTERVRGIDPRFDLLPSALGDFALVFGEVNRAVELYQDDLARNPLDPNALDTLGTALCAANRLQQCLQTRLNLLQLHPDFGGVNSSVGIARLYLGQFPAALQAMHREANEDYRLGGLAMVYWAMGRRSESDAALHSLTDKFASIDAYGIAAVHAYRGEIDDAFRWLDRAYREHADGMLGVKTDPLLRNLHGDRRFQALLTRMRLTAPPQP